MAKLPNGDLYGFGDQDQPHKGKKLLNPLDRVSSLLVLGENFASLAFMDIVYKKFYPSKHGINWDDIYRTDKQNWAGPQQIASRKVQVCLHDLKDRIDVQHERSMGTTLYSKIYGNYMDIFY